MHYQAELGLAGKGLVIKGLVIYFKDYMNYTKIINNNLLIFKISAINIIK